MASTALWSCVYSAAPSADLASDVRHWRQAHETEIVSQLADLTRLPGCANDAPAESGVRLQGCDAPPVVFGSFSVPQARRTVVYHAHYDGQPVTDEGWWSPPFEPVLRVGKAASGRSVDWRRSRQPLDPE